MSFDPDQARDENGRWASGGYDPPHEAETDKSNALAASYLKGNLKDDPALVEATRAELGKELTPGEYHALRAYGMGSTEYAKMNNPLRSGYIVPPIYKSWPAPPGTLANKPITADATGKQGQGLRAAVSRMDDGLKKLPEYKGEATRVMQLDPKQTEGMLKSYTPGAVVREPGYTSAVMGDKAQEAFTRGDLRPNVVIHISSESARVFPKTFVPDGKEVVFGRGTKFMVDRVERVGSEHHVHMREVR